MELKEAVRWLDQAGPIKGRKPTKLQEQYVRASEEWEAGEIRRLTELSAQEARQAKRFRRYSLALGILLLLALVAAGFAFYQRAVARARQLVASSISNEDSDPELSVLFAAHAVAATWPWGHTRSSRGGTTNYIAPSWPPM